LPLLRLLLSFRRYAAACRHVALFSPLSAAAPPPRAYGRCQRMPLLRVMFERCTAR